MPVDAPLLDIVFGAVVGLIIGSFLNVVIHRLPRMLERQWAAETGTDAAPQKPFNLLVPRSHCPHCGHTIAWHENIPVLSYLVLRGRCSACQTPYGMRYPAVELLTGVLFALVVWQQHGIGWPAAMWCTFSALLVALILIDFDTQYLPDDLNYPLLWLGLIAASLGWTIPLNNAVWGAVWGYLSLWGVYHLFRLITGKEGMGHGDFKLLAALGAWFGYSHLLAIVLLSSIVGSLIGLFVLLTGRLANKDTPIPFGPFLAGAGLLCLLLGPSRLMDWIPFAFPLSPLAA